MSCAKGRKKKNRTFSKSARLHGYLSEDIVDPLSEDDRSVLNLCNQYVCIELIRKLRRMSGGCF